MSLKEKRLVAEKNEKTPFDLAYAGKEEKVLTNNEIGVVVEGLWNNLNRIKTKKNDRSLMFTLQYYGLLGDSGKTLEEIGETATPKLTRERVRQLIGAVVSELQDLEKGDGCATSTLVPRPFARVRAWLSQKSIRDGVSNVPLSALKEMTMMKGFGENNDRGLSSFLSGAKIKTLTVKNCIYMHQDKISRDVAEIDILHDKSVQKRKKTEERRAKLAKTVTYVPPGVRNDALLLCENNQVHLNRFYEMVISSFIEAKPWKGFKEYFQKTQSWRARNGESDWVQVGLLIDKKIFEKAKLAARKLKISLMALIARAIAWSTEGRVSYQEIVQMAADNG